MAGRARILFRQLEYPNLGAISGWILNLRYEDRVRPGDRAAAAADHFPQADFPLPIRLSESALEIWHSSRHIPEKCARFTCQELGAHSFGRCSNCSRAIPALARSCKPCIKSTSARPRTLAEGVRVRRPAFISCSKRFAKISADVVRPFETYERISVTRSDCPSAAAGAPSRPLPQHL